MRRSPGAAAVVSILAALFVWFLSFASVQLHTFVHNADLLMPGEKLEIPEKAVRLIDGFYYVMPKTGDISTVAHDAGIVYVPERKPYIIAVLSEWSPETSKRSSTIAAVSYAVYEYLTEEARCEQ